MSIIRDCCQSVSGTKEGLFWIIDEEVLICKLILKDDVFNLDNSWALSRNMLALHTSCKEEWCPEAAHVVSSLVSRTF